MARQREFDESVALEQAMHAFWRGGYTATGVQQLVDVTRVNRASLYGTFGNKHELFLAALNRYTDLCAEELRGALESGATPRAGLEALFDIYLERTLEARQGCLLYNTALEVADRDPRISAAVRQGLARFEGLIGEWVARAQEQGQVSSERPPELVARMLMALLQSMAIRASAGEPRPVIASLCELAHGSLGPVPVN